MAELPSQLAKPGTECASSSTACVRKSSRIPVAKKIESDPYEKYSHKWTVNDKTILLNAIKEFGQTDIHNISLKLPNKHPNQIKVFINNLKSKARISIDSRVQRSLRRKMSTIKRYIEAIEKVKTEPKVEIKPDWYNPSLLLALAVIKNLEEHPKPITEHGVDYKEAYECLAHILDFRGGSSHRDLSKVSKCTNSNITKVNEKKTTDTEKTNEPENIRKGAENEVQCSKKKSTENIAKESEKRKDTESINKNTQNTAQVDTYPFQRHCYKWSVAEETKISNVLKELVGTDIHNMSSDSDTDDSDIYENSGNIAQFSYKIKDSESVNKDTENISQLSKKTRDTESINQNTENLAKVSDKTKVTEKINTEISAQSGEKTKDTKSINDNSENIAQVSDKTKNTESINNDTENVAQVIKTIKDNENIINTKITAQSGEKTKETESNKYNENLAQASKKTRVTKRIDKDTGNTAPSCKKSKNSENVNKNTEYKKDSENNMKNKTTEKTKKTGNKNKDAKNEVQSNEIAKDTENIEAEITAQSSEKTKDIKTINKNTGNTAQLSEKINETKKINKLLAAYGKYRSFQKYRPFGKMRLLNDNTENTAHLSYMKVKDTENINNDTENIEQVIEKTQDTENINIYSEITAQSSENMQDTINKILAIVGKNSENTAQSSEKIQDNENINKNTENSAHGCETSKDSENINKDIKTKAPVSVNRQFSYRTEFFVRQSIYTVLKSAILNYFDLNAINSSEINTPPEVSEEKLELDGNSLESYLGNNLHNPLGFPRSTLSAPPNLLNHFLKYKR